MTIEYRGKLIELCDACRNPVAAHDARFAEHSHRNSIKRSYHMPAELRQIIADAHKWHWAPLNECHGL